MIRTTFDLVKMGTIEPLDDQTVFQTVIPPHTKNQRFFR